MALHFFKGQEFFMQHGLVQPQKPGINFWSVLLLVSFVPKLVQTTYKYLNVGYLVQVSSQG